MTICVLVASFRRPKDLARCLRGLEAQTRRPEDVVVVLRDTDEESWAMIREFSTDLPLRVLEVRRPGVLAANNLALATIRTDLVSFIDDDACPHPDWLEKIERHFLDGSVGAVGGRDRFMHPLMVEETNRPAKEVGRIRWYGRIVNHHHRVFPRVAEADSLKGCNMSFRRKLIEECDEGLAGNACYYELDLCFQVKAKGFRVLFDGNLTVDHYLSDSHLDKFKRGEQHPERVYNDYHNRSRVLLKHLRGPRAGATKIYWLMLEPNWALLRFLRHRYPQPIECWKNAMKGSWSGFFSLSEAPGASEAREAPPSSK